MRIKKAIRVAFPVIMFLFSPALYALEYDVWLPNRTEAVAIDKINVKRVWSSFTLAEKQILAPYLSDLYTARPEFKGEAALFSELLINESDPVLRAYGAATSVFAKKEDSKTREIALAAQRNRNESPPYIALLDFFIALEQRYRSERYNEALFLKVCTLAGQEALCGVARFAVESERVSALPEFNEERIRKLLVMGRAYFSGSAPPFARLFALDLSDRLYSIGLPLEAALIARRFTLSDPSSMARFVQTRVPFYLSSAGDFNSAKLYADNLYEKDDPRYLDRQLDWLMLSGKYAEAVEFIKLHRPEKILPKIQRERDEWTGFYRSPDAVRLKLALLLHLAKENNQSMKAFEMLNEAQGVGESGEPLKHWARLRLAQILLAEKPDLAHKIAEDITYLAQEKGWYRLEYQATVMDGWALYYKKNYFQALINFVKAEHILTGERAKETDPYARLLGIFVVRRAVAPAMPQEDTLLRLKNIALSRPDNEALYVMRMWTPPYHGSNYLLKEAVAYYEARRYPWGAFQFAVDMQRNERSHFHAGENPGGVRGMTMSNLWSRQVLEFASIRSLASSSPPALRRVAIPPLTGTPLRPNAFLQNHAYLFSYLNNDGAYLFLIHTKRNEGRRPVLVQETLTLTVPAEQLKTLLKECRFPDGTCKGKASKEIRQLLSATNLPLAVQFSAEADIDYRALSNNNELLYFYDSYPYREKTALAEFHIRTGSGCSSKINLSQAKRYPFSTTLLNGGGSQNDVWLWPGKIDPAEGTDGNRLPVYLRRFLCEKDSLLFWDMERFAPPRPLALILYSPLSDDPDFERAFIRYFAERATPVWQLPNKWSPTDSQIIQEEFSKRSGVKATDRILGAWKRVETRTSQAGRIIFPGYP